MGLEHINPRARLVQGHAEYSGVDVAGGKDGRCGGHEGRRCVDYVLNLRRVRVFMGIVLRFCYKY